VDVNSIQVDYVKSVRQKVNRITHKREAHEVDMLLRSVATVTKEAQKELKRERRRVYWREFWERQEPNKWRLFW